MSEMAPAPVSAPVTDSAPSTTADIAASTIDRLESQEADNNSEDGVALSGVTPEPPAEAPDTRREMLGDRLPDDDPPQQAPVVPAVPQKVLTEAEQLLADAGYTEARYPDGKPKMIPHHKVTKIIENALKDGKGQFGTQFQAVTQERDTYKANLDEMYTDLRGDPGAFLSKLARADPRYFQTLQALAGVRQEQEAAPEEPMPPPDLPLGNGQWTYSKEGLEKRDAWMQDRILNQVRQELQGELAPIKQREQREVARAQTREQLQQLAAQTQTVLQDAQTWPGFKEHEAGILKALQDDSAAAKAAGQRPRLTLDAAYRQVVLPRLIESDTEKRARLLREANGAPKAPAVGRGGAEALRRPGPVNTADVAARVIARLERNGG